jgi:hypothetical protein
MAAAPQGKATNLNPGADQVNINSVIIPEKLSKYNRMIALHGEC